MFCWMEVCVGQEKWDVREDFATSLLSVLSLQTTIPERCRIWGGKPRQRLQECEGVKNGKGVSSHFSFFSF